jgi:hypothetical protein
MKTKTAVPDRAVEYGFVGNVGCIRFPPGIRKASGIKRGDHLSVSVQGSRTVVLDKFDFPRGVPSDAVVGGCTCTQVPQGCGGGIPDVVSVGWSYVKLGDTLANELGFLPDSPIKLVGEKSRITVSLHQNLRDLEGVVKLPCPP